MSSDSQSAPAIDHAEIKRQRVAVLIANITNDDFSQAPDFTQDEWKAAVATIWTSFEDKMSQLEQERDAAQAALYRATNPGYQPTPTNSGGGGVARWLEAKD